MNVGAVAAAARAVAGRRAAAGCRWRIRRGSKGDVCQSARVVSDKPVVARYAGNFVYMVSAALVAHREDRPRTGNALQLVLSPAGERDL
jgi:hypothetical protein